MGVHKLAMTPAEQFMALRAHRDPVDAREAATWEEVATFLTDPPQDQSQVHITAAGIVFSEAGIVLLQHKTLGIWVQPGGHIEAEESPERAALRESREETGLAIRHPSGGARLVHIDAHAGGKGHRHYDFRYVLQGLAQAPRPRLGESQQVQWCGLQQAIALADDGLLGLLQACAMDKAATLREQLFALSVCVR